MNINVTGPALVAQFEGGVKREKKCWDSGSGGHWSRWERR